MKTNHRTLVFDVDDTLLATSWTYDEAYTAYFNYLYKILQGRVPSLHDLYERYFEIEAELAPLWGVKRGRVAESMVRLYQEVCNWVQSRYGESVYMAEDENFIRMIGDRPFNYRKHFWLPGVKETLSVLAGKGYSLCLLTSYDSQLFPERAKFLGLEEFFGQRMRFIEDKKTPLDYIAVSGWNSSADGEWNTVGNGESDIRPALEIADNWFGIYIPHKSTSPFFKRDGKKVSFNATLIEHPRVLNIKTFRDILNHL